jgi:hypothetical protein
VLIVVSHNEIVRLISDGVMGFIKDDKVNLCGKKKDKLA